MIVHLKCLLTFMSLLVIALTIAIGSAEAKTLKELKAEKAKAEKELRATVNKKLDYKNKDIGKQLDQRREKRNQLHKKLDDLEVKILEEEIKQEQKANKDPKFKDTVKEAILEAKLKYQKAIVRLNKKRDAIVVPRKYNTKCKACEEIALSAQTLDRRRFNLEHSLIQAEKRYVKLKKEHEIKVAKSRNSKYKSGSELNTAGFLLGKIVEIEDDYKKIKTKLEKALKKANNDLVVALKSLILCEKTCGIDEKRTKIIGSIPGGGKGVKLPALPFKWNGPYTAKCWTCEKLAARLNELPAKVRERQLKIIYIKNRLKENDLDDELEDYRDEDSYGRYGFGRNKKKEREHAEKQIEGLEQEIDRIRVYFKDLLGRLRKCEEEHCKKKKKTEPIGYLEDDIEIELETTISLEGTNAFDSKQVEELEDMDNIIHGSAETIGYDGGGTTVVIEEESSKTPPTANTTTTTTTETVKDEKPKEPVKPKEPKRPPLQVTASGKVNFVHIVRTSPCPQAAGTISISSNNGHALSVSGVSVSGTIKPKLNTRTSGNGTGAPKITVEFNCSSPDNGSFNGTITGTVKDQKTGETKPFSISATGTVEG